MPIAYVLAIVLLSSQPSQPPGQQSCPVAEDGDYAYTPEHPVQVGGSPLYGAARQRRYLEALRGPQGQPVEYKRLGQHHAPDGTILDAYEVKYAGLDKPVTLYLDWYHYNAQKAPRGFTCGQPFNLGPPPVSPFQEADDVIAVAFEQGRSREFPPIALSGADGTAHGAVYDRFRLLALAARAAAGAGRALDPDAPPRELAQPATLIVAHPRTCGDRTVNPTSIDVIATNGATMPKGGLMVPDAEAIATVLSGAKVPTGSIALRAPFTRPPADDTIRITYAEACGAAGADVSVRIAFTPARGVEMPNGTLPEGARTNQPVLLQALIDHDGSFQRASYVGGPAELARAAIDATRRWRAEPARVNGAPVATATLLQVRFDNPR